MNIYSTLSILAFVLYLIIGTYPLRKERGNLQWSFFLISIAMALWAVSPAVMDALTEPGHAIMIYTLSGIGLCLLPALFLNFALVLSAGDRRMDKAGSLIIIPPHHHPLHHNQQFNDNTCSVHGQWSLAD